MPKLVTLDYLFSELDIQDEDVVNVTQVIILLGTVPHFLSHTLQIGSRVYGTAGPDSDWDFVSVVVNGFFAKHNLDKSKDSMRDNGFVSTTLTEIDDWQVDLDRHKPTPVICQYAPPHCVWRRQYHFSFTLSFSKLKAQFMSQSRYGVRGPVLSTQSTTGHPSPRGINSGYAFGNNYHNQIRTFAKGDHVHPFGEQYPTTHHEQN